MRRFLVFTLCLVALSGCVDETRDGTMPGPETPATATGGKADVYGSDDRHDLSAREVGPIYRSVARATAVLVGPGSIDEIYDDAYRLSGQTLGSKKRAELGAPLCSEERFTSNAAPGFCSGFLIAPDLLVTAGHCVSSRGCARYGVVFGFDELDGDATLIDKRDYRQCKAVVGHLYDRERQRSLSNIVNRELWSDWAVIQLDEPVSHRVPLTMRGTPVSDGERVAAVGHPGGVPTKVSFGEVTEEPKEVWFNTDLDIYSGNSGSVIVDSAGKAVGIVARGTGGSSYRYDSSRACYASNRCDAVDGDDIRCAGNQGVRVDPLNRFLRATPIVDHWLGDYDAVIPDNGTPLRIGFDIAAGGSVHYATINTRLFHHDAGSLKFSLVAPDGTRHLVLDRPAAWDAGVVRPARTTFDVAGAAPSGRWTLEIVDSEPGDGQTQHVEWAQLIVGVGSVAPTERPTWVGSPCSDDSDCTYEHRGTPGQCWSDGGEGFCTVPCEGYCPDREGFATTFCIESDFGTGACAATPAASNGFCERIPGATLDVRDRYVGSSSAPESSREVCGL